MIDVDSFKDRLGITKSELARRLGLDSKSNTLSLYAKGKSFPTYEMCCKLLDMGMTIEELFGPDIAAKVVVTKNALQERHAAYNTRLDFNDPEVKAAMAQALSDILAKSTANKP